MIPPLSNSTHPKFAMADAAHILKKKQSILSLEKYIGQNVRIVCENGDDIIGLLRGFDSNVNVVLTAAVQIRQQAKRSIGTMIVRGTNIVSILSSDAREIANPYA